MCGPVEIHSLTFGCYFSMIGHHPFNNTLLCLTVLFIKCYYCYLSQEDFIVEDEIQIDEPLVLFVIKQPMHYLERLVK